MSVLQFSKLFKKDENIKGPCEMKVILTDSGIDKYSSEIKDQTKNAFGNSMAVAKNEDLFKETKRPKYKVDGLGDLCFKMLICITMYKENIQDLCKTLDGIRMNLLHFRNHNIPTESVGVVVIFDGLEHTDLSVIRDEDLITENSSRTKLERYKRQLQNKELFFDKKLLEKGAFLHIVRKNVVDTEARDLLERKKFKFRYDSQAKDFKDSKERSRLISRKSENLSEPTDNLVIMLCFKFYNGQKLDSHKWFLTGFCKTFPPEFIALVDCGAKPESDAIFKLYLNLQNYENVAGVCGYMSLYKQSILNENSQRRDEQWYGSLDTLSKICDKIFSIQEAQIFEYSFAHIFDKPFESFFRFISVLPGAFSAYRWEALKGDLLDIYLPNENTRMESIENANQYLAEDRILCLEIFKKAGRAYILKYVPDAIVRVDPTTHLVDLLNQRRRWINGSWYATQKVFKNVCCSRRPRTKHSCARLFGFYFLMVYSYLMHLLSYFILGLYFVYLELITSQYFAGYQIVNYTGQLTKVSDLILFVYICLVGSLIFYSIYYKVRDKPEKFYRASNYLGVFMLISFGYGMYIMINFLVQEDYSKAFDVKLIAMSTEEVFDHKVLRLLIYLNLLGYIIPSIFKLDVIFRDVLFSLKDYAFFAPTYVHNLVIYAFCNVDDLSWGTKGLESTNNASKELEFKEYKIKKVLWWIFLNVLISYILIGINSNPVYRINFLLWTSYFYTTFFLLKGFFSFLYHVKFYLCSCFNNKDTLKLSSAELKELKEFKSPGQSKNFHESKNLKTDEAKENKDRYLSNSQKLNQIHEEEKEKEEELENINKPEIELSIKS